MTNKQTPVQTKKRFNVTKTISFGLWTLCAVGIGYSLKSTTTPQTPPQMPMSEPLVITGHPLEKDIRPFKNVIALVEPINEVDLKPQVSGTVDAVLFENGSYVKEGDILFIIDKSRYEANVQARQADLDKAQANVIQIQNDYNRMNKLYKDKFLAKAELELAESNLAQAKANVSQAEANLKLAQIDLKHATVTAPISGYISKAHITKGNYVSTSTQSLARIVQTNPVRIAFSVTDKERVQKVLTRQQDKEAELFDMHMILPNGKEIEVQPDKIFTESEVDKDTASISVYAEYANEQRLLLPGNVLTAKLSETKEQKVILVSQDAVLQDTKGKYVMKITNDNTATQQYIQSNENIDNYYIVEQGLTPTDLIILTGAQKVRDGQKVKPTTPQPIGTQEVK